MKFWNSYGSEHSANLVMIGRFKDIASAEKAKAAIDELTELINADPETHCRADRYSDGVIELLQELNLHALAPPELEQFTYDICSDQKGDRVEITTQEMEVSAFLKLLIDKGARVEVFSAHEYPDRPEDGSD